jgi:hypothetical protein
MINCLKSSWSIKQSKRIFHCVFNFSLSLLRATSLSNLFAYLLSKGFHYIQTREALSELPAHSLVKMHVEVLCPFLAVFSKRRSWSDLHRGVDAQAEIRLRKAFLLITTPVYLHKAVFALCLYRTEYSRVAS